MEVRGNEPRERARQVEQPAPRAALEEAETIESVVEPYLVRIGFLGRTPRGRIATPEAYAHLRVPHADQAFPFDDL